MPNERTPPRPEGAQADADEWARFFEYFGHARVRRGIRMLSRLPSSPRCEACGSPYTGVGGWLMRRVGKNPSRKNPRWCEACFEKSPTGGVTLQIGVLFADVRNSTALAETLPPGEMVAILNRFYSKLTQVIVQHGIVDKLIGDAVMGLYFAPLTSDGRYVDSMVGDARAILRAQGYGTRAGPQLEVGIGLDVERSVCRDRRRGRDPRLHRDRRRREHRVAAAKRCSGRRDRHVRRRRASRPSTGVRSSRSTSRARLNP